MIPSPLLRAANSSALLSPPESPPMERGVLGGGGGGRPGGGGGGATAEDGAPMKLEASPPLLLGWLFLLEFFYSSFSRSDSLLNKTPNQHIDHISGYTPYSKPPQNPYIPNTLKYTPHHTLQFHATPVVWNFFT